MRAISEYRERAREYRKLASMVHNLDDKYALDCAAQTCDKLAERRKHDIKAGRLTDFKMFALGRSANKKKLFGWFSGN
jgi:hypothetical protein